MSDDQPDPIREIRTELINHADPIVQQAYEYIVDLELAHAKRGDDHAAEVERLRADPRLTLTADDLYVILSWCPVRNETAGRVRRVADALEKA